MSGYRDLRVTIEPKSAFLTPLVADTLWGHLLWAELYSGGDIQPWVDVESNTPPLILSDVFPEGWLPAPVMPAPTEKVRKRADEAADADPKQFARLAGIAKRAAKMERLPEQVVRRLLEAPDMGCEMVEVIAETFDARLCPRCLVATDCDCSECPALVADVSLDDRRACAEKLRQARPQEADVPSRHTAIDRLSFTALEGQLFDLPDRWIGGKWVCWARTTLEQDHLKRLMQFVSEHGYGKRASIGKGRFDVVSVAEGPPLPGLQAKHGRYMLLSSSYVPEDGCQLSDGDCYRLRVKRGKRHDSSKYIKKPVAMFEAGSVFKGQPQHYVGRLVPDVHTEDEEVVEYGLAYPVAF